MILAIFHHYFSVIFWPKIYKNFYVCQQLNTYLCKFTCLSLSTAVDGFNWKTCLLRDLYQIFVNYSQREYFPPSLFLLCYSY